MHRYDLHGVTLAVAAENDADSLFLEPILAPLAAPDDDHSDWTISISHSDTVDEPVGSEIVWRGPLPEGTPSILSATADRSTIAITVPQHLAMAVQPAAGAVQIAVTPVGLPTLRGSSSFWLLDEILANSRRYLLHGACLAASLTGDSFALFAPSGTGKTTTALALARNGLALAGDDALVLDIEAGVPHLWGIPRAVKIGRNTARLLPWLAPHFRAEGPEEQAARHAALGQTIELASADRRRCGGIIVLAKPNPIGHRARAIVKADALTHIATDNVRRWPSGVDGKGQAAFAAIAQLVMSVPTIELSVGPDPETLTAEFIFDAMRRQQTQAVNS
jgi:hypothetical protein